MHALFTRNRAEAFRAANPTPSREKLTAFLAASPRPLPAQMHLSPTLVKLALYAMGAVVLGLIGTFCH